MTPRRIAVVGAGMVGLSAAWFLQEHGIDVTVLERDGVAAGSSWGNAGWVTPAMVTPLPEPAVLRYALRAFVSAGSPVYVPLRPDLRLLRFLAAFAGHSTARRWAAALRAMIPFNRLALESYDLLAKGGVESETYEAPVLAAFETASQRAAFVTELEHIRSTGQAVDFDILDGAAARAAEPLLSERISAAVRVDGQRYVDPGAYVRALADAVRRRGGQIRPGAAATEVLDAGQTVSLPGSDGTARDYDAVILATGARLGRLAGRFGVRTAVQSGRGYSFSVATSRPPGCPLYFPGARVACTPIGGRLRVAGTMEFRAPGDSLDPRRIQAMTQSVAGLFRGINLEDRAAEWVGARPCTPDGLPVIGATRSPRVFVAGGHGMWGITLGPVTGRLLAQQVATGAAVPELAPFDPLR